MLTPNEFQKQRLKMLDIFLGTERELNELTWTIPLDNESSTYSPKLYSILQGSCGQVENMLRIICDRLELQYTEKNFPSYYELLNKDNLLGRQWLFNYKTGQTFHPLEIESGYDSPSWWRGYNGTKHKLPEGIKNGNIENTVYALSSLYAIHCIAFIVQYYSKDILEKSFWYEDQISLNSEFKLDEPVRDSRPKSTMFYCATKFNKEGAPI